MVPNLGLGHQINLEGREMINGGGKKQQVLIDYTNLFSLSFLKLFFQMVDFPLLITKWQKQKQFNKCCFSFYLFVFCHTYFPLHVVFLNAVRIYSSQ